MRIDTKIFSVDGVTVHEHTATTIDAAKLFLDAFDHEGSTVRMQIDASGSEVYELLDKLTPKATIGA